VGEGDDAGEADGAGEADDSGVSVPGSCEALAGPGEPSAPGEPPVPDTAHEAPAAVPPPPFPVADPPRESAPQASGTNAVELRAVGDGFPA